MPQRLGDRRLWFAIPGLAACVITHTLLRAIEGGREVLPKVRNKMHFVAKCLDPVLAQRGKQGRMQTRIGRDHPVQKRFGIVEAQRLA